MESKHKTVCDNLITLKNENDELKRNVKDVKTELSALKKEHKKDIRTLESENKKLNEFKVLKSTEEKNLKARAKKLEKKLKSIEVKEAKLELEKDNFERMKKVSCTPKQNEEV